MQEGDTVTLSYQDRLRVQIRHKRKKKEEMLCAPALEVIMIIVFLKLILRPCASVTCPSSRICSRILNISGCAFFQAGVFKPHRRDDRIPFSDEKRYP